MCFLFISGLGPVNYLSVTDMPIVSCVPLVTGMGVCSRDTLFLLAADRQSTTVSCLQVSLDLSDM